MTAVIDARISGNKLNEQGILIDIDIAKNILGDVIHTYNHKNLDIFDEFKGQNTTCEVIANAVWRKMANALAVVHAKDQSLGNITELEISLAESDVASASYSDMLQL